MPFTNDTKPTGSFTQDSNPSSVVWDDAVATWDDATVGWDSPSVYAKDSKPSGSFTNDVKPT